MKISLGWINKDGYSEEQIKAFANENAALDFCIKHINNIARINGLRIHRDFEDSEESRTKTISEDDIIKAIKESV